MIELRMKFDSPEEVQVFLQAAEMRSDLFEIYNIARSALKRDTDHDLALDQIKALSFRE